MLLFKAEVFDNLIYRQFHRSSSMDIVFDAGIQDALLSAIAAAFMTYFLTKKMQRDNRNEKRKFLAIALHKEISDIKEKLDQYPRTTDNTGADQNEIDYQRIFLQSAPLYTSGGLLFSSKNDFFLFDGKLADDLLRFYDNIVIIEDARKDSRRGSGTPYWHPDVFTMSAQQPCREVRRMVDPLLYAIQNVIDRR